MSETIRAAWIGAVFTMVGVVITLIAQPIITERLGPKHEGLFSVEQTCLSGKNLDPMIASQVASFPCQLRLAHIEGPSVSKISVSLTSKHPLADVKAERNDENIKPTLSANASLLTVEVPTLRQGSVIDIRFLSKGDPQIDKNTVRESGKLLSELSETKSTSWLETWYGIALLVLAFAAFAIGVVYLLYTRVLQPTIGTVPTPKLLGGLIIAICTMLPILDIGSVVQTILLLAILHVVSGNKVP